MKSQPVKILIEGLEVRACHGVLPEEKTKKQVFVFDLSLTLNGLQAVASDDISHTADYAAVCDTVTGVTKQHSFNLLEKLAAQAADEVLNRFPLVMEIELRVTKTSPPMPHKVKGVAVSLLRKRETFM